MRAHFSNTSLKAALIWAGVFAFRLLPLRAPNVEPLLASLMPLSGRLGALGSFFFATSSIVLYDAVTSGWGMWTLVTAISYGALALGSYAFFRFRAPSRKNFVLFSLLGVLLYDAVTGFTVGPLFFGQSFFAAFVGQIPFTCMHLAGAGLFAAVLSPALERWLALPGLFPTRAQVAPESA